MKHIRILSVFILLPLMLSAQTKTSLHSEWTFGLDPVNVGVAEAWFRPDFPSERWDKVAVPHCYTIDPRYHYYTGTAWYFKRFPKVSLLPGIRSFIRFEAVFYKAQVWLNGKLIGEHEGGYTPFEFDVTDALGQENVLAIRVNNAWDTTTIPGAKTNVDYQGANARQLFPWINYGGITREVMLVSRPSAYIRNARVIATPDLAKKTASLQVFVHLYNGSSQVWRKSDVQVLISQRGKKIPAKFKLTGEDVAPQAEGVLRLEATLSAKDVRLWHFDDPVLYRAECIAGKDTFSTTFGIRKVEVAGTKLLLNGEPLHLGGCNRPLDYPGYGSMDPPQVLEKDLALIKSGGMELSRISHYPVSTHLLDWADEHGLLIIGEAGNWQMTPKQMADPQMRAKFQSQMKEMVERDWNHPSIIAWSVGNEYQSQTEEGKSWTKDMYAFSKSIDPSRLVTFASMIVQRETITKPEDEASQYVDFISANIYGGHLKALQHIHDLYPDKPIYVSEFGIRTDDVKNEQDRINYLKKAVNDFRQCDFVIGASVWTFNDYQSIFPGTNANGDRPWGLVAPDRQPRGMYYAWQDEFSPATVTVRKVDAATISVTVTGRSDFPRYTLRNYVVKVGDRSFDLAVLKPGETRSFTVDVAKITSPDKYVQLIKPGGFVIVTKPFPIDN